MALSRRRVLQCTALGSIALAGCSGGDDQSGSSPTDATSPEDTSAGDDSSTTVVEMANTSFDPATLSVDVGTTVEWVNEDGFGHDVTATQFHDSAVDWDFAESVSSGASATYTFEDAGVYEYVCTIHGEGSMCGAVVVGDATLDASLPCEGGGGGGGGQY